MSDLLLTIKTGEGGGETFKLPSPSIHVRLFLTFLHVLCCYHMHHFVYIILGPYYYYYSLYSRIPGERSKKVI